MDFTIFYKTPIDSDTDWNNLPEYDVFVSTYDCSERVNTNFNKVRAKNKHWLVTPHYKIPTGNPQGGQVFSYQTFNEDDFIFQYFEDSGLTDKMSICVDITGFIRPFILYFFRLLAARNFAKVDVIYAEPRKYKKSEETEFSGFVEIVKPVPGCTAADLLPSSENDVLILAVGYDDKLISAVSESKRHCRLKYKIFGFPSLQADMYQESVLQVHNARESLGHESITLHSPAFDPFVTAQLLKDTIDAYMTKQSGNFYISPLSTKPQTLGFILYYVYEGLKKPVNIVFPYSNHYSINNCEGVKKTWHYVIEFPKI